MNLVDFPQAYMEIAKHQPEYICMPAHIDDDGIVTCCWQLSWWERLSVLFGGRIWHQILTFGHSLQPQSLTIHQPSMYMTKSMEDARARILFNRSGAD